MSEGTLMGIVLASMTFWPFLGGLGAIPLALTAHRWGTNVYLIHLARFVLISILGFSIYFVALGDDAASLWVLLLWNIPSAVFLGVVVIRRNVTPRPFD